MPSLADDIQSAKGHISNTPQRIYFTGSGFGPYLWFGDDAVAATEPWTNAPMGSIYIYKASEAAVPVMYMKNANAAAIADWYVVTLTNAGGAVRIKELPITVKDNNENDTGWDLPPKAVVLDVWVNVTTLEGTATTKTIDVGLLSSETGGDADGFLDGVSTGTPASLKQGIATVTTGANTKFYAATPTRGVLLIDHQAGTDVDQDEGLMREKNHLSDSVTAKSVSYTLGSAHTELVADIYIMYAELGL